MILKGNQRGNGLKLAMHLLNDRDNEHVEVHELRGFSAQTLRGAFQEADAVSKGTKCRQYLFSLSLSPPETEKVSTSDILDAVERVEKSLGLDRQARAIVFHEKNGRRHAHAVWSRIDVEQMKAVHLSFSHNRLKEVSKELFLDHGWRLPDGFRDRQNRDPRNFTLAEWQQAKRVGKDARQIKTVFQEAWTVSDGKEAFAAALEEKGYFLARGDRRGFVAVDAAGEVYAVPKSTGQRARQVREKLGDPKTLRSVDQTRQHIAATMQPVLSGWEHDLESKRQKLAGQQDKDLRALVERQRIERQRLKHKLEQRQVQEARQRQARFRAGLSGLWDRLRGEHRKITTMNEREAWDALLRDRARTDQLIFLHLDESKRLKNRMQHERVHLDHHSKDVVSARAHFDVLRGMSRDQDREGPHMER